MRQLNYYKNNIYNHNDKDLDIIFYHKDCADGTMCSSLWLLNNVNNSIESHLYPIQPSSNMNDYYKYKRQYERLLEKRKINFIFLDIVPLNIYNFIKSLDKRISIVIVDHHIGNTETVESLRKLPNITIDFQPNSLYGATKQVLDRFRMILSKPQIEFAIKIAAMDMWNRNEYIDVNNLNFGIKYYCYKKKIRMLSPDSFIDFSYHGNEAIEYFVKIGKEWFNKTEAFILKQFNKKKYELRTVNYKNYNIGIVNLSNIFDKSKYSDQKSFMSGVICIMVEKDTKLKDKFFGKEVNTLAFVNNNSVSLRIISDPNKELDMDFLAKKICRGGGHKAAAGCSLQYFIEYFK